MLLLVFIIPPRRKTRKQAHSSWPVTAATRRRTTNPAFYVIIGTRLLATIHGAGRPTLWKLGVAGLSGMGIFNFVVIVDTARKLWKFGVRTPMPTPRPMRRLSQVDRWRGSKEELIRLLNGGERPAGAPRPRQMSLEEVERHRLSLPGGDRLGVSRRRPAARVVPDS
jgi:hypothetical protein